MKNEIIKREEIYEILEKYNIGKKPLSLVLGWGEITIIRYLDGQIPVQFHSDILKEVKADYHEFSNYLEKNKELITDIAYKKAKGKIVELQLEEDQSIIYLIAKHIISETEDITPLALQKLLYYIEGFSLALLNCDLFEISCEAWVHGPVYREIYDRFSYYSYHAIEKEEFQSYQEIKNLDSTVIHLIDEVIDCFGCYSGKILEKMTHLTAPWQKARSDIDEKEPSAQFISKDEMKHFFKQICKDYHITSVDELSRYSKKIFNKVTK